MMKSHHSKTILAWVRAPSFSYIGPDGECEFIPRMTERFRLWICMSFRSRQVGFDPLGIAFSRFATMLWPGIFDLDRPLGLLC